MGEVFQVWSPVIQGGFAVFALALLGINVWLIRQLLRILRETTLVVAGNTRAIEAVTKNASATYALMQDLHDRLLQRPCLHLRSQSDEAGRV